MFCWMDFRVAWCFGDGRICRASFCPHSKPCDFRRHEATFRQGCHSIEPLQSSILTDSQSGLPVVDSGGENRLETFWRRPGGLLLSRLRSTRLADSTDGRVAVPQLPLPFTDRAGINVQRTGDFGMIPFWFWNAELSCM